MNSILKKILRFLISRIFIFSVAIVVLFFVLVNRLFQLQIIEGENYLRDFNAKILREIPTEGTRGNIYDRYGRPLAKNNVAFSVNIDDNIEVENKNEMIDQLIQIIEKNGDKIIDDFPIVFNQERGLEFFGSEYDITHFKQEALGVQSLTPDQAEMSPEEMFSYLKDEFGISDQYSDEAARKIMAVQYEIYIRRFTKYKTIKIAVDVSDDTVAMIKEHQTEFPNVTIETEAIRVYPYGESFAHILGYTGRITKEQLEELSTYDYDQFDVVGRTGIEKEMEVYLKGTDGKMLIEVDGFGRRMNIKNLENSIPGKNIYLTIDKDLQLDVENILVHKLASILASKLTPYEGLRPDEYISTNQVFEALVSNNILSPDAFKKNSDAIQAYVVYRSTLTNEIQQVSSLVHNGDVTVEQLLPREKEIFYNLIDILKKEGIILASYDEDISISERVNAGTITPREFFEYMSNQKILNLNTLNRYQPIINETQSTDIENAIVAYLQESLTFQKQTIVDLIDENKITDRDMLLVLNEEKIISLTDDQIADLKKNRIKPVDILTEKILDLSLTPQNLGLDPSSGSIVVTDVNTGDVLALISYPSYDNNRLVNNFDYDYYLQLLNDPSTPLIHRALKEKNAPGSTFKMVTAMAALEEGAIGTRETIYDKGRFTKIVAPHPTCWIYNQYGGSHGAVNVRKALEVSCNYFFYETAFRLSLDNNNSYLDVLGINKIKEYASLFGLGSKSGIQLDEYDPYVSERDAVRTAIGQGDNNFAPIHLARYVSTLANGGTNYYLNVIDQISNYNGEVYENLTPQVETKTDFNEENLQAVYEGMHRVTAGSAGTVRTVFRDFPIEVAGKTGTAQQSNNRPTHALFVGYAPYENPEIAISVVIPFGGSSTYSAEIFKDVVGAYFELGKPSENITMDNILQ